MKDSKESFIEDLSEDEIKTEIDEDIRINKAFPSKAKKVILFLFFSYSLR